MFKPIYDTIDFSLLRVCCELKNLDDLLDYPGILNEDTLIKIIDKSLNLWKEYYDILGLIYNRGGIDHLSELQSYVNDHK